MKNYKDLFNETKFQDALKAKKVCLFLGSGVAFNLGMPDWRRLATKIVDFCMEKQIVTRSQKFSLLNSNSPLKIISICIKQIELKNKQDLFNDLLKSIFYEEPSKNYISSYIYKNLSDLYKSKSVLILQTNYDVMLEKFQTKEEGFNRNYYIPYKDPMIGHQNVLNSLIYLHGRFSGDEKDSMKSSYEDLILNKRQYNNVYVLEKTEEYRKQKKFLQYLLKEFYIIFLGYSLSDTEILQLIANKPKTESYKQIVVIADNCDAKFLENEFNEKYLEEASNGKIKTYTYETDKDGIEKGFEKFVKDLTNYILIDSKKEPSLIKYTDPKEVNFD